MKTGAFVIFSGKRENMEHRQVENMGLKEINRIPFQNLNIERFVQPEFGIVYNVNPEIRRIMIQEYPYRLTEGRLMLLRQGKAQARLNLKEITVNAPAIVIISPGTIGQMIELSDDMRGSIIVFKDEFVSGIRQNDLGQKFLNGLLSICLPLSDRDFACIEQFFATLWSVVQTYGLQRDVLQSLLQALLQELFILAKQQSQEEEKRQSRQEQLFNQFIALVNQYAKSERNVSFYADRLYLTPRYLNSVVKQVSRRTVMDWVNDSVILEAKVMLKYGDKLIYQIADELNFPNVSFFCKFFKRQTGMTPQTYQRSK